MPCTIDVSSLFSSVSGGDSLRVYCFSFLLFCCLERTWPVLLTKPALIEALRNPDGEVRGLAAWQLVEMKAEDSLPQILQAVRDERDNRTKVDLASAAAYLGAKEGTVALEDICHDSSAPGWVRTDAARHLFDLQDRACLSDLWKLMDSRTEADTRIAAINLVSRLYDRTASESAQVERFTLEALDDSDTHLRLYAATILADLRDTTAIPYLRMAIQVEKEDVVKSQMENFTPQPACAQAFGLARRSTRTSNTGRIRARLARRLRPGKAWRTW
jgi:hypothetical protein